MENDSIRASGGNTLIDIWVDGKLRAICVTRAAIETFLGVGSGDTSEEIRGEFVRTHLPQLATAVKARLRENNPSADAVIIDAGQLGGIGDRRRGERRAADRRKTKLPADKLPHGERRRSQRRRTERRQSPKKDA